MSSEACGCTLLMSLPDDVLPMIIRSLLPRDLCNLSSCCKNLYALVASETNWIIQCEMLGIVDYGDLSQWGKAMSSYKALCRFLVGVKPLMGIWAHQNPELGNVVYVMPGFASVVGCRIIPQEVGALGVQEGPLLWAPVFEIISDPDGAPIFFLHGRDKGLDCMYPGSVKDVEISCNMLLLEVEPESRLRPDESLPRKRSLPFQRLPFRDRRRLLEIVTGHVYLQLPVGPLFPRIQNEDEDMTLLLERRALLLYKIKKGTDSEVTQFSISEVWNTLDKTHGSQLHNPKKKTIGGNFSDRIRHILGLSASSSNAYTDLNRASSSSKDRRPQLPEFLKSCDSVGLRLRASTARLTSYRTWPNMQDSQFALYKLPVRVPDKDHEFAGLWGGTFGWPHDKPGKTLFVLLLSYEESEGERLLIGTKILEGTQYVLHPNGSAMFIVKVDQSSDDNFPGDTIVKNALEGEGIANGYGFRYPSLKPGSLFVMHDGVLAFVWKDSRAILTLQRLNLQQMLKKGKRMPPLPPTHNFSYLTKSYSNVFTASHLHPCITSAST